MKNKQYLLKFLLSTSLVGCLTLVGFLQEDLMAGDTQQASSKIFQDAEGSTVQISPDGTKIIKKTDGSIVQIKPDGTKFIQEANGTSVQIDPNGTKTIKKADGTLIQIPSQR